MDKVPIITKTPLTERWTCITKWRKLKNGNVKALKRFDIQQQMESIIAEEVAKVVVKIHSKKK